VRNESDSAAVQTKHDSIMALLVQTCNELDSWVQKIGEVRRVLMAEPGYNLETNIDSRGRQQLMHVPHSRQNRIPVTSDEHPTDPRLLSNIDQWLNDFDTRRSCHGNETLCRERLAGKRQLDSMSSSARSASQNYPLGIKPVRSAQPRNVPPDRSSWVVAPAVLTRTHEDVALRYRQRIAHPRDRQPVRPDLLGAAASHVKGHEEGRGIIAGVLCQFYLDFRHVLGLLVDSALLANGDELLPTLRIAQGEQIIVTLQSVGVQPAAFGHKRLEPLQRIGRTLQPALQTGRPEGHATSMVRKRRHGLLDQAQRLTILLLSVEAEHLARQIVNARLHSPL